MIQSKKFQNYEIYSVENSIPQFPEYEDRLVQLNSTSGSPEPR